MMRSGTGVPRSCRDDRRRSAGGRSGFTADGGRVRQCWQPDPRLRRRRCSHGRDTRARANRSAPSERSRRRRFSPAARPKATISRYWDSPHSAHRRAVGISSAPPSSTKRFWNRSRTSSQQGFEVTLIQPDRSGYVSADEVLAAVRPDTLLVSVMHANNETGAIQPIAMIAEGLSASPELFFHVDAAQSFGRETADLRHPRIDLISLSAHKLFAPKGVGALVARRRDGRRPPLTPLMYGGGQERTLRPGTLPIPLIAGFGLAAELAHDELDARHAACLVHRAAALDAFTLLNPVVHGDENRGVLPHILSLAVPGLDSEAVMVASKGLVAISNGSACTSAKYEPSHVLRAMALPPEVIDGTLRISWSHMTPQVPWSELVTALDDLRF